MINILKKGLMFLFILILASILFNVNANNNANSSAQEIVEIIENNEEQPDGYVEQEYTSTGNNNIFSKIVSTLSNFIRSIFSGVMKLISQIISSFTNFLVLNG